MAEEELLPSSQEEPEVFEIDLPITVLELSDDDFLGYGEEEYPAVDKDGYFQNEDRRIECEDEQLQNHGKNQIELVEVVEVEDDSEETMMLKNNNVVQMASLQNVLNHCDHSQNWRMGFLDHKVHDGIEITCVKTVESNDSFYQKILNPYLSIPGAASLETGFKKASGGPKKNIGLEDDAFPGSKSRENWGENEQCDSCIVNNYCPLGNFLEEPGRICTKDGCSNGSAK
ncbi:uncharacterized protein LOC134507056 [Candoia aspera]|uniref:uncharacterized protein LOC134507056 n=1 Tax=Candoia aspera TaxID=51853 RepID=UPI002FD8289D